MRNVYTAKVGIFNGRINDIFMTGGPQIIHRRPMMAKYNVQNSPTQT